jgi:DNA recombination protein RmuC
MDPASFALVAGLLAMAGTLIGIALGRHVWPAIRGDGGAALHAAEVETARLSERAAGLEWQVQEQIAARETAEAEAKAALAQAARLGQREADLVAQLGDVQQRLTSEFENIATRVLTARSSELSDRSQKDLGSLLEPLRQRLQDFQAKVETTYQSETREMLSLKEQIRLLVETSHAVGSQADGLAQALRGQSQLRGRWGEIALERILETAGLVEGREYISQGRGLGLRNEEGGLQRPDIVVLLPEQRTMIIDSKLPLLGYERLIACADEAGQHAADTQFVRDV